MVTHRLQWLALGAMLASAVWACPEVRAQGRNDKKPKADPDALTDEQKNKVQVAIDLLNLKAASAGEDPALKACIEGAMAALQAALSDDPPRVKQAKEGEGPNARKEKGKDIVVIPPELIAAPPGDILGKFIQLLDTLLHEGIHLKQGIPDPTPDHPTGEDELARKILNIKMEQEAYDCESKLKNQIATVLNAVANGQPAPDWAKPFVDAAPDADALRGQAASALVIGLGDGEVAVALQGILDFTIPYKQKSGLLSAKQIADEIDLMDIVKKYASGSSKRVYVIVGGAVPGRTFHNVYFADPRNGAVGFQSLDVGIAAPQGGLLLEGTRGDTHFLICGQDVLTDPIAPSATKPPHGVIKDFFDSDDDGTLDGSRTLVENQEGLIFPTSLARLADGRVYVFDAQTWSAYPLVDTDRDGVPDLWLASPVLTVPPGLRDRHPVDLLPAGDALVLQPRIAVTLDNNAWRMVFTDPDGDGIFQRGVVDAPPPSPGKKGGGAAPPEPPGGGGRK